MTRVLLVVLALAGTAHANGRSPVTNGVAFQSTDNDALYVRSTFGLLISRDGGCSFRWVCEQAIGYGGTFDPKYAIAADGTLYATTFTGLRVSRDGGCSFTTATAELPAGAPGRIADIWVDALDLGPTGEVWVATAESGRPNDIYRSTDGGRTFASRNMVSSTMWWKSLAVARSDAQRVYASSYEATPTPAAHVYVTLNGGETWDEASLAGVQLGATPTVMVAAIDPADAQRVYIVSVAGAPPGGDRLYRSINGGTSFAPVLVTAGTIRDVVIRDATTVFVVAADGTYRSTDGGATFAPMAGAPKLGCLGRRPDGTLVGCAANWDPDFMAIGTSADATQWQKVFRFVELGGPLACPVGTPGRDVCDQQMWPGIQEQFGATGPKCDSAVDLPGTTTDGPPPSAPSGGCCETGGGSPLGGLVLALAVVFGAARIVGRRRPG